MKIYISADMEGVAGVTHPAQCRPSHPDYGRFRRLLTEEVNAAIAGAVDAGATEVVVNDAHFTMTNVLVEELHPIASLVSGSNKLLCQMEGLDESFDGVFFVGYHEGDGLGDGVVSHTLMSAAIRSVRVDGVVTDEALMNAKVAGCFGVSISLLTGDDRVCAAAVAAFPGIEVASVKRALDRLSAQHRPVPDARRLMVVIGIYVFIGNSGVFSFGHPLFMAVGAYTTAILVLPSTVKDVAYPFFLEPLKSAHLPGVLAVVAGGAAAMVAAVILAVPLMRLSGLTAAVGTFVLLIIGNIVISNLEVLTGGTAGLSGIPGTGFWVIVGWTIVCLCIAWIFQQGISCSRLRASREDFFAAQAVGIRISRERTIAFALSAFIVGIAGGAFAQVQQAISPSAFYLEVTFITIAMLVVGGLRSLTGAVFGTLVLSALSEVLSRVANGVTIGEMTVKAPSATPQVGLGIVMLLVLLLRPRGLTGGRELSVGPLVSRLQRSLRTAAKRSA